MISFTHGSKRNTKCYIVCVGGVTTYISYETVIAAEYKGECVRAQNTWGPTTGRHMRDMGVYDWPQLSLRELYEKVDAFCVDALLQRAKESLGVQT